MKGDVSVAADVRATAEAIDSRRRAQHSFLGDIRQSRGVRVAVRCQCNLGTRVVGAVRSRWYTMARVSRCPMLRARY